MKWDAGLKHFLVCEVFYIIKPLGKSTLCYHTNDNLINAEGFSLLESTPSKVWDSGKNIRLKAILSLRVIKREKVNIAHQANLSLFLRRCDISFFFSNEKKKKKGFVFWPLTSCGLVMYHEEIRTSTLILSVLIQVSWTVILATIL